MAITYRSVAVGSETTGTGDRTATGTPASGDLWVIVYELQNNSETAPTCSDDNSDGLGTYYRVGTALWNTDARSFGIFVREALFSNTNSTTVTVSAGSNGSGIVAIIMCSGSLRVGANAVRSSGFEANGADATTPAPTLNQAALTANMTICAVASTDTNATPPTNWTERVEEAISNPSGNLEVATRDSGFTGTALTYGAAISSSQGFASGAIELDGSAPASVPYGALIQATKMIIGGIG